MLGLAAGCWWWWVGIYTSWLRCGRGCGLALMSWARPTTYSTSNSNSKHARMLRFTTRYNRQQHATTTHHITAQHNTTSASSFGPQARTLLCPCRLQIFAATLSFQAAAQPSLAHITSQHWPNILQIFYTAEYLHISVITARTRGRGCLGSGYGGVR